VDEQLEERPSIGPSASAARHRRLRLRRQLGEQRSGAVVCCSAYSSIVSSTMKLIVSTREPPMIASRPSAKRTIALPLPS
jgi:hypothetical protein